MLCMGVNSFAFAEDLTADKPATKIEQFSAKTGSVIIKRYTDIGKVSGIGSEVEVTAIELIDANSSNITKGISISVTQNSRIERSSTSFIDFDEIDSLIKGMEYVSSVKADTMKHKNFEARYKTKGNFEVVIFNERNGDISAAISSGLIGKASAFIKLDDFVKLKQLILDSKSKL